MEVIVGTQLQNVGAFDLDVDDRPRQTCCQDLFEDGRDGLRVQAEHDHVLLRILPVPLEYAYFLASEHHIVRKVAPGKVTFERHASPVGEDLHQPVQEARLV